MNFEVKEWNSQLDQSRLPPHKSISLLKQKLKKDTSLKEDSGESLKKRLFPEDDQNGEERFKALYQERLERMMQANEKMKKKIKR